MTLMPQVPISIDIFQQKNMQPKDHINKCGNPSGLLKNLGGLRPLFYISPNGMQIF